MINKIKQIIYSYQRGKAIASIRESFHIFGYNLDEFSNEEIEKATRLMGSYLLPATSFKASEAAEALSALGKIDIMSESVDEYRERLLQSVRQQTSYKIAEQALIAAQTNNRDIVEYLPLAFGCILSEKECIKLAENHLFSIDDIKQIFWDGKK